MGSQGTPVIHYDYEFSPVGQKTKLLLTAAGVPFERVDQPAVLPRKDLESLGITYRRIPLLAIGKDVYVDSALIFDTVLEKLAKGKLQTTPADKAWEAWGYDTFQDVLTLAPHELLSDDFVKDRETIFPILARSDYKTLRPSGIAQFQSRLEYLEKTALANGGYINGNKLSVADIHVIWGVRWALNPMDGGPPGLGSSKEAGLGKEHFPTVWKLIESLPAANGQTVDAAEAAKKIESASFTAEKSGVDKGEPTGIQAGKQVTVDSLDAAPHSHPQAGKLVSTSNKEIVLELPSGIHLHFPRVGYILREA